MGNPGQKRISRLRSVLKNARQRCENPKSQNYHRYGGRGIKFRLTFEDICYLWILHEGWKLKKPSLNRIYNDKDYEVYNCEFIEMSDNIKQSWWDRREKALKLSKNTDRLSTWKR